jgi:hypothetical protein
VATIAARSSATSAGSAAKPTYPRKVVRWTGAIGIIVALVLVAGFPLYFLMGTPPRLSDTSQYAAYLTRINGLALGTKLLDTLYVAGFLVFLVGIRDLIRTREAGNEWAAALAFGAGLVVIRALTEATLPAFGAIGLTMTVLFLIPASWGILATRVLPRWTGWMGYAVALITLIAVPTIFGGNDFLSATIAGGNAASGLYSYSTSLAGLAFIAWLLVVGGSMFRAATSKATAGGEV